MMYSLESPPGSVSLGPAAGGVPPLYRSAPSTGTRECGDSSEDNINRGRKFKYSSTVSEEVLNFSPRISVW